MPHMDIIVIFDHPADTGSVAKAGVFFKAGQDNPLFLLEDINDSLDRLLLPWKDIAFIKPEQVFIVFMAGQILPISGIDSQLGKVKIFYLKIFQGILKGGF